MRASLSRARECVSPLMRAFMHTHTRASVHSRATSIWQASRALAPDIHARLMAAAAESLFFFFLRAVVCCYVSISHTVRSPLYYTRGMCFQGFFSLVVLANLSRETHEAVCTTVSRYIRGSFHVKSSRVLGKFSNFAKSLIRILSLLYVFPLLKCRPFVSSKGGTWKISRVFAGGKGQKSH